MEKANTSAECHSLGMILMEMKDQKFKKKDIFISLKFQIFEQ